MPYKDTRKQGQLQLHKFQLWREMKDGLAATNTCRNCDLPIYALDPGRFTEQTDRWLHFCDPKAMGIRPFGKNEPVYDLVRTCWTALEHRYTPEAFETHDGTMQGVDPRIGAIKDLKELIRIKKAKIDRQDVATPKE